MYQFLCFIDCQTHKSRRPVVTNHREFTKELHVTGELGPQADSLKLYWYFSRSTLSQSHQCLGGPKFWNVGDSLPTTSLIRARFDTQVTQQWTHGPGYSFMPNFTLIGSTCRPRVTKPPNLTYIRVQHFMMFNLAAHRKVKRRYATKNFTRSKEVEIV